MRNMLSTAACIAVALSAGGNVYAQAPAAQAAPAQSTVVANPTYTSIVMETTVNRPAAEVCGFVAIVRP